MQPKKRLHRYYTKYKTVRCKPKEYIYTPRNSFYNHFLSQHSLYKFSPITFDGVFRHFADKFSLKLYKKYFPSAFLSTMDFPALRIVYGESTKER